MCLGTVSGVVDTEPVPEGQREASPQVQPETCSDSPPGLLSDLSGHFIEDLGQLGEGTGGLYCLGDPLSVYLGPGHVDYSYRPGRVGRGVLVRVEFLSANLVEPIGVDPLPHPTNFLKGDDPDQWVVGARSFREVLYPGLWEGIDLVYRLDGYKLKYDLLVAPFADLNQVRFRYYGQEGLTIAVTTGDLVIRTPVVDLVDTAPMSFQTTSEDSGSITSKFRLVDDRTVDIEVEGYDPTLPLVIDPGLNFSTYLGGEGEEFVGMVDVNGDDVYMIGTTVSEDFPCL